MEGPEGRAGVSGVLVQWPARGLPCRIFSVSGTQCAAVALHRSGCFWGWRLFLSSMPTRGKLHPGALMLGCAPCCFLRCLSPVLAGDLSSRGTACSLLWHPWAHGCHPTPPSLFCSFVLSWAPQSGAE